MSTQTLLTLEQFSKMPEYDEKTGNRYELDHGELIIVPPPPLIHEFLKNRISKLIDRFLLERHVPGETMVETGVILDEDSWRVPDIGFFAGARIAERDMSKPLDCAPDLAIEIVSPSDTAPMIKRKIDHLLAAGVKSAWVVYHVQREVHVYRVGVAVRKLKRDQYLEEPEILPGFRVLVDSLFP